MTGYGPAKQRWAVQGWQGAVRQAAVPGAKRPIRKIPWVVRGSYLAFIFTLPFEAVDLGALGGSLSLARLSGLLFLGCYLLWRCLSSRRSLPRQPQPVKWFLLYGAILGVNVLLRADGSEGWGLAGVFTIAQLLIFCWFTSDLLGSEGLMRQALMTYVAACLVLGVGVIGGVPGLAAEMAGGRAETFGDNPNISGQHLSLAALALIGLVLAGGFRRHFARKGVAQLAIVVLLSGMVATGSRSAAMGFIAACALYLLPQGRSNRVFLSLVMATVGIGAVVYMIVENPYLIKRWEATYYQEDWAGRQAIYGAAVDMILEEPVFGWGPVGAFYELGKRVNWVGGRDVHNLVLDLLIGVGIVGAIPFLIGVGLCIHAAWAARTGPLGLLPISLIVANMVANMAHTNLTWKPQWFVFGLACAAVSRKIRAFDSSAMFQPRPRPRRYEAAY